MLPDRKSLMWAALAVVCVNASACSPESAPPSTTKHDMDRPIREMDITYQWIDLTRQDYEDYLAPLFGISSYNMVDEDDAHTRRAQFWLDVFDEKLRAEHAEDMRHVPKPTAMVLK